VASVPVDVKRICSAQGTARQISSARASVGSLTWKYVVPRASYAARLLQPGDRVEILEAVGGG